VYMDWNDFFIGRKLPDCWNAVIAWIKEFEMEQVYSLESKYILTEFKSKLGKTYGEVYLEDTANGIAVFVRLRSKDDERSLANFTESDFEQINLEKLDMDDETPEEAYLRDSLNVIIKSLWLRMENAQKFCTNCDKGLKPGWIKCPYCNAPQGELTCSSCGEALDFRWVSCPNCGAQLKKAVSQ